MKLHTHPRAALRGNILIMTLVVSALAGLALVCYLGLVSQQTKVTARSQTYQSCMTLAEAGIEDALAHLNKNGVGKPKLDVGEWSKHDGNYTVTRDFGDGYYKATIQMGARPIITSTGYLPAPLAYAVDSKGKYLKDKIVYVSRTIKVQARAVGRYTKAIVAKNAVNLNGKSVVVNSFDSYNTNSSIWTTNGYGTYNSNSFNANGDVAVVDGMADTMSVQDAKVWGKIATGPDGNLKTNKNVVVGDIAWHNSGVKGVQDGWATDDANFDMPKVDLPYGVGGSLTPANPAALALLYPGYKYILSSGDYWMNNKLDGKVLVLGNARLVVNNDIDFKDDAASDDGIIFAKGATLSIYGNHDNVKFAGGKTKKGKVTTKNFFNEDGNATNFMFYGTDNVKKVDLSKCDEFTGVVYAPNAEIKLKAGSTKYYHCEVFGALLGKNVTLEKNASLHYDENIANLEAESYVIESWAEIANSEAL